MTALVEGPSQRPLTTHDSRLTTFLGDVIDELGSRKEIEYAYRIMDEGTSADRQLATFRRTNSLQAVVDQLIQETEVGVL